MEAREKAQELENGFRILLLKNSDPMNMMAPFNYSLVAKECALLCVDEILKSQDVDPGLVQYHYPTKYWNQVKSELK